MSKRLIANKDIMWSDILNPDLTVQSLIVPGEYFMRDISDLKEEIMQYATQIRGTGKET